MRPHRIIYLIVREDVEGPFSLEEVRRKVACGAVQIDSLCAEHGTTDWKPLAEFLSESEEFMHSA